MIIPPAALVVTAFIVVARLVFSLPDNESRDTDAVLQSEHSHTDNSTFQTNCRFQSDFVLHRDLSSKAEEGRDQKSFDTDETTSVPTPTDDPNKLVPIVEGDVDPSELDAETPVDTDT